MSIQITQSPVISSMGHISVLQNVYAAVASGRRVTVSPPCIDSKPSTVYMNREDVKKALHIAQNLPQWQICRYVVKL